MKRTRLSDVQLELGLQTNVKRHSQTLHYNGRDIADLMPAGDDRAVFIHIATTEDQPIALLPTVHIGAERQAAKIQRIIRKLFYTLSQKTSHFVLSISSPNINRFSEFFHWHTLWTVGNKVLIEHPTAP